MTLAEKLITIVKWYKRYDLNPFPDDCLPYSPIEYENFTIQDDIDLMFFSENRSVNCFIGTATTELNLSQVRQKFLQTVNPFVQECMEEIETCLLHITVKNGMLSVVSYPSTNWNQNLIIDVNVRQINITDEKEEVDLFTSAVNVIKSLVNKHYGTDINPDAPRKVFAFHLEQNNTISVTTFADAYFKTDNKCWMDIVNFVNDKTGPVYNTLMAMFKDLKHNDIRLVQWGWIIDVEWGEVIHNDGDLEHGNMYYASPRFTTHVTDVEYIKEVVAHAKYLPHRST